MPTPNQSQVDRPILRIAPPSSWTRLAWCDLLLLVCLGCNQGAHKDLSTTAPFSDLIGAEYRVLVDDLYAYGVYGDYPDKSAVTDVVLIPGVGVGGPEFAFKKPVPKGTIIRIQSVWRQPMLFDSGVYFIVKLDASDSAAGTPTHLELFRGNEGEDETLNPRVYERVK